MNFVFKLIFHSLFIIPLVYQKYFYSLALICLVLVFYAKVFKFQTILEDESLTQKDRTYYTRVKHRWMFLTFLKD